MAAATQPHSVTPPGPVAASARPTSRIVSLRWIATVLTVVLSALAAMSVGFISERNARRVLIDEIQTRLMLQVRNLAAGSSGALLSNFPELTVQPLIKAMMAKQPELAFAVVLDNSGHTVGHPEARYLGKMFERPEGLAQIQATTPLGQGESLTQNRKLLIAGAPVSTPDHRVIGSALVALDRAYIEERLDRARRQQALVIIACLILSITLSIMLMSRLLNPLTTLRKGLQRIGQGDLETPIRLRDRTELGTLAQTVNEMARDLKQAQTAMLARERLEHEVDIAREIQRSLLPSGAKRIGNALMCGDQQSATEVGGDYYDILPLPDGRVAITIADVAGKGLPGCLVMAMLSASLRAMRGAEDSPSRLLTRLDAQFAGSLSVGMFVTVFYGVLDPLSGRMVWASAGHNPMLIYRAANATVERSESRGIPVGALRGGQIERTLADQTLQLEPGDVMVHYTDGYTEAVHPDTEELFGLERVVEVVKDHGMAGPQRVVQALIDAVHEWTRGGAASDDETLLVLGWEPSQVQAVSNVPAAPGGLEMLAEAKRRGIRLELSAIPESVSGIAKWVRFLPGFEHLPEDERSLLGTALLEVCSNIAEHGYGLDAQQQFEVWWLPPATFHAGADEPPVAAAQRLAREGHFVARDHARPFHPEDWSPTDFSNREARTRGRGFGLDIIHSVLRRADYYPSTASGNITLLAFGPRNGEPSERASS